MGCKSWHRTPDERMMSLALFAVLASFPCVLLESGTAERNAQEVPSSPRQARPFETWQVKAFVAQGPAAFRARTEADPRDPSNYLMGANACAVQGDFPGAIAFLER